MYIVRLTAYCFDLYFKVRFYFLNNVGCIVIFYLQMPVTYVGLGSIYNSRLGLAGGEAEQLIVSHRYVSKRLLSLTLLLITPLTAINVTQLLVLSWFSRCFIIRSFSLAFWVCLLLLCNILIYCFQFINLDYSKLQYRTIYFID